MYGRARACPVTPAGWSAPDPARSMRPVIVSLGLADQQELDELDRAVRATSTIRAPW